MLELNKVMLVGNLTRDPELSYVASGTALAKLGIASPSRSDISINLSVIFITAPSLHAST